MDKSKNQDEVRRTTLSLPEDLHAGLEKFAAERGISFLGGVRLALRQVVESSFGNDSSNPTVLVLRQLAEIDRSFANPYQSFIARWRLERVLRQLEEISAFKFDLEVWPAEIYSLRVLTELHQGFTEKDEFLVVTNLNFWHETGFFGPESSGLYLAAQEAAIARGLRLVRVFLLTDDDITSHKECLRAHGRFLSGIRNRYPSLLKNVSVRFKRCSNIDDGLLQIGHFACVRRRNTPSKQLPSRDPDEACVVLEPVYQRRRLSHLRFLFSRGSSQDDPAIKFFVDRFLQAEADSRPVEELVGAEAEMESTFSGASSPGL